MSPKQQRPLKKRWIAALIILAASIFAWKNKAHNSAANGNSNHSKPSAPVMPAAKPVTKIQQQQSPTSTVAAATTAVLPAVAQVDYEEQEIQSLESLAETLFVYSQYSQSPEKFTAQLQKLGLKPILADWSTEETGKMFVARTKNTLPGTRYIHAQFFEDEEKRPFMQHMSFEFRPGPQAMDTAVKMVEQKFGTTISNRKQNDPDYVLWSTDNGYIVWVQKMSEKDLKDNPTNAYSKADVGTIKIVVEQEIHAEAHGHDGDF